MFTDTINKCAANAGRIARLSANNPLSFWVSAMMAGAYRYPPPATCSPLPFGRW